MHLFGKDGESAHRRPGWFRRGFGRYGYGRNFLGDHSMDMLTSEEKNFQEEVRTHIEEILLAKFEKTNMFSEAEKQGVQMTIGAQIQGHSKVIFEEACHRVEHDKRLQEEIENMTKTQIEDIFMEEVKKEAERIALDEFEFDRNIDIRLFMKREKDVKERMQRGEITREEAYELLREPIVVEKAYDGKESHSQRYEENYRAYNQSRRQRGQRENSSEQRGERRKSSASSARASRCKDYRKAQYVPPRDRSKPETNKGKNNLQKDAKELQEQDLTR